MLLYRFTQFPILTPLLAHLLATDLLICVCQSYSPFYCVITLCLSDYMMRSCILCNRFLRFLHSTEWDMLQVKKSKTEICLFIRITTLMPLHTLLLFEYLTRTICLPSKNVPNMLTMQPYFNINFCTDCKVLK